MTRTRPAQLIWMTAILASTLTQPLSAPGQGRHEALQNHNWRLKRLGNLTLADSIAIGLQFQETTYSLSGGCNRAKGGYWTRGLSRIGFEVAVGHWRACPRLNLDAQLADALRRANRYRVHTSTGVRSLSLRRGLRVLAVLEARK